MEVTAIERKMFGQKMRLKSMSCTEIVHPRWKAARPFTDSLEQINIITNAIRTDFVQQMQLFDVFIPILCFPLDAFFSHLSHSFFIFTFLTLFKQYFFYTIPKAISK